MGDEDAGDEAGEPGARPLRVALVASEVAPWCQTGGLADVVGALPGALREVAGDTLAPAVFCPLYPQVRWAAAARGARLEDTGVEARMLVAGREQRGRFWAHRPATGAPRFFLEHPAFFHRAGLYGDARGGYADNAQRFAFFSRAVLAALEPLLGGPPDLVHVHDWQSALLPVYARSEGHLSRTAFALTIHNLGHQGLFPARLRPILELRASLFHPEQMEFHGQLNLLKGGIACADAVTTVSPSYAEEIQTPAGGMGLDGFIRRYARRLRGIVNGLAPAVRDPAHCADLPAPYGPDALAGKARCRAALLEEVGLRAEPGEPLLGVVSRLDEQKGLDLVADLVPELERLGARLVLLGSGSLALEARFRWLGQTYPERLAVCIGFDAPLASRILAGADLFLMPSRFEPCGLTQRRAQAYGTPPVVRAVGGLRDTVADPGDEALARGEGSGFVFRHPDAEGLRWALERAIALYREQPAGWDRLVRACMAVDVSWERSAREYLALYRELVASLAD